MCLKRANEILINSVAAIKQAKKEKKMNTTLCMLIFEWFLIALGTFLLLKKLVVTTTFFFLGIVGSLFLGFLVQLVFTILGGKGRYFEGLTSVVYSLLPMSAAVILSSIFVHLPVIGVLLSFVVAVLFVLTGLAVMYRAVKELFSTDMITTLVGMGILGGGIVLAFYFAFFEFIAVNPTVFAPLIT
jgi:hypothetical protein